MDSLRRRWLIAERPEAGETLVELVMALALMGIVVVGIVGGLATTVLSSQVHRSQADANAVLVSAMETIKSNEFDWSNVDCSKTAAARQTAYETRARTTTMPTGWSSSQLTVTAMSYESVDASGVSFGSTCTAGLNRQLVTLQLTSPDGRVASTYSFVKGDL
jgi:type II secretory pathway pseudopilin PulG